MILLYSFYKERIFARIHVNLDVLRRHHRERRLLDLP